MTFTPPSPDCLFCPRLCTFRSHNRLEYPTFFNAPVPSFGPIDARMLVVGLAPGLKGANATGRPFTGDYAGDVLFASLLKNSFATGSYSSPRGETISGAYHDNLTLVNCRVTNAVRCVPQENKPEPAEINQCNAFLKSEIAAMSNLKVIVSLGLVSHNAVLKAMGLKAAHAKFVHGAQHVLPRGITLLDSYHCSRYNINTGRLTQVMFDAVIEKVSALL